MDKWAVLLVIVNIICCYLFTRDFNNIKNKIEYMDSIIKSHEKRLDTQISCIEKITTLIDKFYASFSIVAKIKTGEKE